MIGERGPIICNLRYVLGHHSHQIHTTPEFLELIEQTCGSIQWRTAQRGLWGSSVVTMYQEVWRRNDQYYSDTTVRRHC